MARACCLIRQQPHYRAEAFKQGLVQAGYDVHICPFRPTPDDVLVVWNRYGHYGTQADIFEAAGARVIVAENGYLGRDGDRQYYAIALNRHNGAGESPVGGKRRIQGLSVQPWRTDGDEVVILAQRGIGCKKVRQPDGWVTQVMETIKRHTDRPVRVRAHPGKPKIGDKTDRMIGTDLLDDLSTAWCAVTWGSCSGLKALCAGIPVFHGLGKWIGRDAALSDVSGIESPRREGRSSMLRRVAWAQWTVDEIARGDPFRWLLQEPSQ